MLLFDYSLFENAAISPCHIFLDFLKLLVGKRMNTTFSKIGKIA